MAEDTVATEVSVEATSEVVLAAAAEGSTVTDRVLETTVVAPFAIATADVMGTASAGLATAVTTTATAIEAGVDSTAEETRDAVVGTVEDGIELPLLLFATFSFLMLYVISAYLHLEACISDFL